MVCTEVPATLARSTGLAGVRPDWSDTESTLNIEGVMLRVILMEYYIESYSECYIDSYAEGYIESYTECYIESYTECYLESYSECFIKKI